MAGDIPIRERLVVTGGQAEPSIAATDGVGGHVLHDYGGQVLVVEVAEADGPALERALPSAASSRTAPTEVDADREGLGDTARLGVEALALRGSPGYRQAKAARPLAGRSWATDEARTPGCLRVQPPGDGDAGLEAMRGPGRGPDHGPSGGAAGPPGAPSSGGAAGPAGAPSSGGSAAPSAGAMAYRPLSSRLDGRVAVGLLLVEGPTPALRYSAAERAKIVAETQNGLSWLGARHPDRPITWRWDIEVLRLDVAADAPADSNEARFLDPAMAALGHGPGLAGADAHAQALRQRLGTDHAYVAIFTRYPVDWFAYAYLGGPLTVMEYENDGWGPDNIDRVFAHETGHIFHAPDEYAGACDCGGAWGFYGRPNDNCETCAPGGGVPCIMKSNDWAMCQHTPWHVGFPMSRPRLVLPSFGYTAGNWRVERHPRTLAHVTHDWLSEDVVGFGNDGVWLARGRGDGTFDPARMVVPNFGHDAGNWRVDRHPRFVADVTGDGLGDIVGFGNQGVWVARSKGDGTFTTPAIGLGSFGYSAGNWRVDRHPRTLAHVSGRWNGHDLVGFGNGGVWVAPCNGDGTFDPATLVLPSFGHDAGNWRVDRHPRLLAHISDDWAGEDIVGFGNGGVWVARAKGDGTFHPAKLVLESFGHDAGNWRVDRHPRLLADVTGDGLADIVGFGNGGVWVARAKGDGTFHPAKLVLQAFGYEAGNWRVDRHPRLLADLTGDGLADIVGFGNAGVWVAHARGDGTFATPRLAAPGMGYDAGNWRVDRHPRLAAQINASWRQGIVGFGNGGVWTWEG